MKLEMASASGATGGRHPPSWRRARVCSAVIAGLLALSAAGWGAARAAAPQRPQPIQISQGLVLRAVTVVDTRTGARSPDMAVVIRDGRIAQIVSNRAVVVLKPARSIEARGRFVTPGYLDMHSHALDSADPESELSLMLVNGITGFRQMSGSPELLEARRLGRIASGERTPELLAMPGSVLTPQNGRSADEAIAEVDRQWRQGADFIKVVSLSPPSFFAAMQQAEKRKLPFVGHLPATIDIREAARAGMKSIEHMGPSWSITMSCSTDEAQLRASILAAPQRVPGHDPGTTKEAARLALANGALAMTPAQFELIRQSTETYDQKKCEGVAATLIDNGVWLAPTLVRLRAGALNDDLRYLHDRRQRYVPKSDRVFWKDVRTAFISKLSQQDRALLAGQFAEQMRIVGLFNRKGVQFLAGTDAGGVWEIPGFALHDEFDLLAEAGVPPLGVLQATTLNGARFLQREEMMGTVEQGKVADLVLLNGDPVADARNLHRIWGVVRAGKFYSRGDLDRMAATTLKKIEASDLKPAH